MTLSGKPTRPVILQVLPTLVTGGAERGCLDVAAGIVAAGGTAIVASAGGPLAAELPDAGAEHVTLPLAGKTPWRLWRNADRLAALIRARGVDIVHARSRAPAWSAWLACRRTQATYMTTLHAAHNAGSAAKRLYNSSMVRGARVIAISRFIADYAMTTYGVPEDRIRIVDRGIDLDRFSPGAVPQDRVRALADAWNVPPDSRVILAPGRLVEGKGHMVLADALAAMSARDVVCLVVGGGHGRAGYAARLAERVAAPGLGGRMRLVGLCDDMPAAYALADVVAVPSLYPEGFGRTIVEAQAMGKPVVAADNGAPRDLVVPDETGWLVPPGDAAALAAALDRILALDPDSRNRIAATSIATAHGRFSRTRMVADTLAVYGELLGRPL